MEKEKICQSCTMPLIIDSECGTNKDGSKCEDYCVYCYCNGKFTKPLMTKEQMMDLIVNMAKHMGKDCDEVRERVQKVVPKLKRWQ